MRLRTCFQNRKNKLTTGFTGFTSGLRGLRADDGVYGVLKRGSPLIYIYLQILAIFEAFLGEFCRSGAFLANFGHFLASLTFFGEFCVF